MLNKIKKKVEQHITTYLKHLDALYGLTRTSALLFKHIQEFVQRPGKRVRPTLFVAGYLGYAGDETPGLYTSALSLELLHDFMLVHDDVIDKSALRRGRPAMHTLLDRYLAQYECAKFNGEDLAIVIGDIMYALALRTFLTIQAPLPRKEAALKKLIEAALYTGTGEFSELLLGLQRLTSVSKKDITRVYDLKTAYYTFACPLSMGAILGGAKETDVKRLTDFGMDVGRAFQIKDDILGMFQSERQTGKSALTDLAEAKKTLLIWYAFANGTPAQRKKIQSLFAKRTITHTDLNAARTIIRDTGALAFAKGEVTLLLRRAQRVLAATKLSPAYANALTVYAEDILSLK